MRKQSWRNDWVSKFRRIWLIMIEVNSRSIRQKLWEEHSRSGEDIREVVLRFVCNYSEFWRGVPRCLLISRTLGSWLWLLNRICLGLWRSLRKKWKDMER